MIFKKIKKKSNKFVFDDCQKKQGLHKESEIEPLEKKKLHHQKSNSFNTNTFILSEQAIHEQKSIETPEISSSTQHRNQNKHLFQQKNIRKKNTPNIESNSNSTNLSNSNISLLSGISSHDAKHQQANTSIETPNQEKNRLSFLTNEKSIELSQNNPDNTKNVANLYVFMSPSQRQRLLTMPIKRKWTVTIGQTSKRPSILNNSEKCLVKDTLMTKSAQNFPSFEKTHLYRQGINFLVRKKQYPQYILKGHLDGVRSLAVSQDKQVLISASEDKTLKLWELKKFEKKLEKSSVEPFCTLRGHKGPVFSLSVPEFSFQNKNSEKLSSLVFSAGAEVNYVYLII